MKEENRCPDLHDDIRRQFIIAEKSGIGAIWKTYSTLTHCHEKCWEQLSAICMAAEERISEVSDCEMISAYLAMLDMIDSLAAESLEEPADYHSFCKSRANWEAHFWRTIQW